jgi:hypothetical protein
MSECFTPFTSSVRLSLERARIEAQRQKARPEPERRFLRRKLLEMKRLLNSKGGSHSIFL